MTMLTTINNGWWRCKAKLLSYACEVRDEEEEREEVKQAASFIAVPRISRDNSSTTIARAVRLGSEDE